MNSRVLALSVLSMLSAAPAYATTTLFDSYNGSTVYGVDGNGTPYGDQVTEVAQEFYAGNSAFNMIDLALTADSPGDGKSVDVYLVTNSSASIQSGDFSSLTPVGIVADSTLVNTGSVLKSGGPQSTSLTVTTAQIPTSSDGEYWVVVVDPTGTSSFEWFSNVAGFVGPGTAGQWIGNNSGSWDVADPNSLTPVSGQYDMVVSDVPEPATIAVLGAALAGLGFVRRRKVG